LGGRKDLAVDGTLTVALSGDGTRIAYVAAESGVTSLYVRPLDRFEPVLIPESEGATFPFFSPDGQWIGFFTQGKLRKALSTGATPITVCDLPQVLGATWLHDDTIVVAVGGTGLMRVPAAGGEPKKIAAKTVKINTSSARPFTISGDWIGVTNFESNEGEIIALNIATGESKL